MIEWLIGSSRPAGPQYASGDDGATFLDEAPETPAPLFAVRAFKTAIFGTPQPVEYKLRKVEERQMGHPELIRDGTKVGPEPANITAQGDVKPTKTSISGQKKWATSELPSDMKSGQLVSPTKGILLTPGTAATKRKTVSFSARKEFKERANSLDNAVELESQESRTGSLNRHSKSEPHKKQSALTRTLIEMSTKRSSAPATIESARPELHTQSTIPVVHGISKVDSDICQPVIDVTLDLSQPRSRSGQHWKAEYEEYQKNSTREMKKIIQYGQNVKSYATKKDMEAASLSEKLQKELANVARMESKISKLAKQLEVARARGPQGESEQARLIGELAQQNAMTARYQRKAEQYQKAIAKQSMLEVNGEQNLALQDNPVEDREDTQDPFDLATTQAQLESLREIAEAAENRAAKLEIENKHLKRNLARVKEEMMSYESRRQAREERLKKREERHKASKEQCETQLADLLTEHQKLLQATQIHTKISEQPKARVKASVIEPGLEPSKRLENPTEDASCPPAADQTQQRQSSLSPRKKRSQNPAVDIWTVGTSHDSSKQPSPKSKANALGPSIFEHDIDRALNEISHNLAHLEPSPPSQAAADSKTIAHAESLLPIDRLLTHRDTVDDHPIRAPISFQPHTSTTGRSGSLFSHRASSRANTMGSARTSSLSADRAAAARARLAQRRKSGGKKNNSHHKKENRLDSLETGDVF